MSKKSRFSWKIRALKTLAPVLVLSLCTAAHAGTLYSTSFENPPYAADSQLVGTDGWTGLTVPLTPPLPFNVTAATVTDTTAATGTQSIQINGSDLQSTQTLTDPYFAVGTYHHDINYTVTPPQSIVRLEGNLLLQTTAPATSNDFFSMTLAAISGDGETLGEFGLSSSGVAEAYGFNVNPGTAPIFTSAISFNTWNHLAIDINYTNQTASYSLNGALLGTTPIATASNIFARGSMVVYALPDGSGGTAANYTARFDDFSVSSLSSSTSVPLPAGVWPGLVLLGALAAGSAIRSRMLKA